MQAKAVPPKRRSREGGLSLIRHRELRLGKPANPLPRVASAGQASELSSTSEGCPAESAKPRRRTVLSEHRRTLVSQSAKIDAALRFRICSPRVHIRLTLRETLRRSDVDPLALTMRMEDMRFVYVLRSEVDRRRYYSGITSDVTRRLAVHNSGGSRHTATLRPWQLVASVQFASQESAALFERYLKTGSGRAFAKRHFI